VTFGSGFDICLQNADNQGSLRAYSNFGSSYENDTGISGKEVFAPDPFKVEEVEVFEITD
jgi:hypothetical protein